MTIVCQDDNQWNQSVHNIVNLVGRKGVRKWQVEEHRIDDY
jgi:hypothetical protein